VANELADHREQQVMALRQSPSDFARSIPCSFAHARLTWAIQFAEICRTSLDQTSASRATHSPHRLLRHTHRAIAKVRERGDASVPDYLGKSPRPTTGTRSRCSASGCGPTRLVATPIVRP
jgi:hypothetical protein